MPNWFYQSDGKEIGPIQEASMVTLIQAGQIKPTDLIRREDQEVWVVASQVEVEMPGAPSTVPPVGGVPAVAPTVVPVASPGTPAVDRVVAPPAAPAPAPVAAPVSPPAAVAAPPAVPGGPPAPPPLPEPSQWYYSRSAETGREGPVSTPALGEMVKKGVLKPSNVVWKKGMAEWMVVSKVKELASYQPASGAKRGVRTTIRSPGSSASSSSSAKAVRTSRPGARPATRTVIKKAGQAGQTGQAGPPRKPPKVIKGQKRSGPPALKKATVKRPIRKSGGSGKSGGKSIPKSGPKRVKVARLVRGPGEPRVSAGGEGLGIGAGAAPPPPPPSSSSAAAASPPPSGHAVSAAPAAKVQEWFYSAREGAEEVGPVRLPDLLKLFADGVITPEWRVWTKGMVDWIEAKNIPQLMDLLKPS